MTSWWILIAAVAAVTYAMRASFIVGRGGGGARFPVLERYVPVAALTALIVPSLWPAQGEMPMARAAAILVAAAVAYKTKNFIATVAVGMVVLLLIR